MIAALIGLLLPIIGVWLALLALGLRRTTDSVTLTTAVAFGCGTGLSSASTFWLMAQWGVTGGAFVTIDVCLWTAVSVIAWWHLRRKTSTDLRYTDSRVPAASSPLTTVDWLVRAAFCTVAIAALATTVTEYVASPHGQWDAWAIWNQKARFLFRGGDQWTTSLSIPWSQPSHPLLVSASVARSWSYAGAELTVVPAVLSLGFGIATVCAVMGALDPRRPRAWMAGTVVMAPGAFVQLVAAQTADLPTGFFVVATLIVLGIVLRTSALNQREVRGALFLAGMLGGLAAWTKNEGLLLLVVTALIAAWTTLCRGHVKQMAWWAAGALPTLATVTWLKFIIAQAPPGYFAEAESATTLLSRLFAPERHAIVNPLVWRYWTNWGGPYASGALPLVMAAAAMAVLTPRGRSVQAAAAIVSIMLGGYYAVWLMSPIDTTWLVSSTFDRLMLQLWPSMVLIAFAGTTTPGDRG